MNKKQKEFSIKSIKKYKNEIQNIHSNLPVGCFGILFSIILINSALESDIKIVDIFEANWDNFWDYCWYVIGIAGGSALNVSSIANIVYTMAKKANLESLISRLEYEIKLSELEEQESLKR